MRTSPIAVLIFLFSLSIFSADSHEPPRNSYLADSPWPMTHRNPYCQASSPLPGPHPSEIARGLFKVRTASEEAVAITLNFSPKNEKGHYSVWGSSRNTLYKLNSNEGKWRSATSVRKTGKGSQAISGAYTLLDKDGRMFFPRDSSVFVYEEEERGEPKSRIRKVKEFRIPEKMLVDPSEVIVGMNLTYDGYVAMVTDRSLVIVMNRATGEMVFHRISDDEEVSNSLAVDEDGGIYVVTHKRMIRMNWTGHSLEKAWESSYPTSDVLMPGRLGRGSGTTPTLMGTGNQDKLVVIADGEKKMNIIAFWRDKIPENWKPIPGFPERVAGITPILFGNPERERSITDQSLLVRGYEAVAVNNDYGDHPASVWSNFWIILWSNYKDYAPYGIEKFEWVPEKRLLRSVWANSKLSVPNGIPTMSSETNQIYYLGQHEETWTIEGVDWQTGELSFRYPLENSIKYNSYYAAMEIGYDGALVSGTVGGALRLGRE
ncbi:hypothetical protein EBT16_02535 [bacterium]|nr:hypothetical protein [bacterium]